MKVIVVSVWVPMSASVNRMTVGVMVGCQYSPIVEFEGDAPFVPVEFI